VDKRSAKVGEAVTLTFLVEGAGNLKALESPKLPELPAFRTYDTISSLNMRKDKDVVQGSKAFRTVLVPRASGRMVIPSIPFSWFDPSADRYVQAATAPIELDVAAAAPGSPAVGYASPNRTSPDLTALGEDIRYIKESLPSAPVSSALRAAARGRWIHLLPLIAFLCAGAAKLYRDRLNLDPAGRRFRSALAAARRRIDEAGVRHAANSPQQAAELLEEALARFLADKLDRSASGLTLREATDLLRGKFPGVKEETLQDIKGLWEDLEAVRFAGDGSATSEAIAALLKRAGGVLRKLDQEIRR